MVHFSLITHHSMLHPRDKSAATTVGMVRVARTFSNVVSPPVMFAVLGLALALRELAFWPGLLWAAVYGFFVSLAPILFILLMLRAGHISDLHISVRQQRHLPYLVSIGCAAVALLLLRLLNGPELLRCLVLFNIAELVALGVINVYWQISIHATAVMATTLIAGLVFGLQISLLLSPFVILVAWARHYLRRHTAAQILAGLGLGALSALALNLTGCF
ncbi:MAG: hypothetical protein AB1791_02660 [Chloroflexota bacterium]